MIRYPGLDDNQSVFLEQQLTNLRAAVKKKLPELKMLKSFPITMNSPRGAQQIKVPIVSLIGRAKIIASNATDIPRADVTVAEVTADVREIADSFGILQREIENAAFANVPLSTWRMSAALRAMEQEINRILVSGDSASGLLGLLAENSYFNKFANPSGAPWTMNTDPADIVADIGYLVQYAFDNTNGVEESKRVIFSSRYWSILIKKRAGTLDNKKIITEIRETWPDVEFGYAADLNEVTNPRTGSGTVPVAIAHSNDPEAAALELPLLNEMMPTERKGLEYETIVRSLCAGVLAPRPMSVSIMDFPS